MGFCKIPTAESRAEIDREMALLNPDERSQLPQAELNENVDTNHCRVAGPAPCDSFEAQSLQAETAEFLGFDGIRQREPRLR
jgi:hypothetical protein